MCILGCFVYVKCNGEVFGLSANERALSVSKIVSCISESLRFVYFFKM